ncbi:AAA family ATPase [Plectonema cf. radiosum LEGE 06105]|uniref:non-specific serine/threonine protein kinase n=1 Tax=Plectonema cf. radiosum LEGE 06105 TaxID=945769 RepID=A0A8J7F2M9_9CYAN|nr:ATPase domain-containing protein [Plectonema radiosum]MBE9212733.1 AAA family ATPase [Plectonema cf. radiosum LEGE 06105]
MNLARFSTGIVGFDEILKGGLIPKRAYLARGGPGCGKTILGLHFLAAGIAKNETSLYITLGEPATQIKTNGAILGFDTEAINFLDLSPGADFFRQIQTYDIFSAAEVEREPTTQRIIETVESLKPVRVLIDSMTHFRYLCTDDFQFRKQVLSFVQFLLQAGATVLFTSESSREAPDDDLQFISDGVIDLHNSLQGRSISVTKFRGSNFLPGLHSLRLTSQGMQVAPRLQPQIFKREFNLETISSGIPELDELLHGGIERGTVTIVTGPTGVGKTTLGLQFMKEAAGRGERSVIYNFEENEETLLARSQGVNIPIHAMIATGNLSIVRVEPLDLTPDEFANLVRYEVEQNKARIVMIDSIAGYRLAMRRREDLVIHLHALCKYLQNMGITVIVVNETENITGDFRVIELGISYIADNIIFLRYLEIDGKMQKAIGVLKKRLSDFEKSLREIEITRYGIKIGKPLINLRKILSGTPEWVDINDNKI